MVQTPWGDSDDLRGQRLAPGRGQPRREVQRNQRQRLFGAMVALVSTEGYAAVSVSDLSGLSGVSSRAFYELFTDKEDCFLATLEAILRAGTRQSLAGLEGEDSLEEGVRRVVREMAEELVRQPAAARLWMVDAFCSGERARARVDESVDAMAALWGAILTQIPERAGMPAEVTWAILAGGAGIIYRRLASGEEAELPKLADELSAWMLSIPPPPRPLRSRGRRSRVEAASAPPFAANVPGERVLRAFAAVIAEKGYEATTIADVAAAASISQNTFYAHFADKAAAFRAALDSSGAQMLAAVAPAVRRSPRWPGAVRVAIETMCAFLESEPAYAHLRAVETPYVGPEAVEQRSAAADEIVAVLEGLEGFSGPAGELEVEATVAAIHGLLYKAVRDGGARGVARVAPVATYITLAPTLGAEAAWEAAVG